MPPNERMISEQQQDVATRCALGELSPTELQAFQAEVRANPELGEFFRSLQMALDSVAHIVPQIEPPPDLKRRILSRLKPQPQPTPSTAPPGLRFLPGDDTGWKPLPVRGAFIKLLSLQADRGYAVLLGKLDPGTRYPAHINAGPEDFFILTGDLHVGNQVLGAGDFHHADAGSQHTENFSVDGCTLLAVLTTDDPLVQLAMA